MKTLGLLSDLFLGHPALQGADKVGSAMPRSVEQE